MNIERGGRIPPPTRKLVIRKANSQRDLRPITERATLQKVLGLTVSKNAALACDPLSGIIAYPAGCVVVFFNPRKNKQSFILTTSKKTITSLAFSGDGKYLATGESGHMPSVRVWDVEDSLHPQISEMTKGHKFGISCVAFSPNLKYVASVGFQHDMIVNVWNWKNGTKVASNKVSAKVSALSFSESGSHFVTVGVRHVKFWYFDTESNKSKVAKTVVINGRAALLGEQRNNTFCDVACGCGINSDITYCVTSSGLLCSINSKRVLDTWVELKTSKAQAIAVSEHYIICGCTDGIIRVFNPLKLQFIATLPKPHFLGVNVAEGIDTSNPLSKTEKAIYPDTVAVALDTVNHRLTCIYNDHSLYVWDIKDMKKIGKSWSSLYHSACVWGVEVYPSVSDNREAALPPGSFLTCSADATVRVWNIDEGTSISFERNVYSKEMIKVIYMEDTVSLLKDTDISPAIKNMRDSTGDTKNIGVRCLRISADGQTLATGDRSGNVRIYDLMFFDEIIKIEAHESEVLCVEFSPTESGFKLLASAGRDRLIHIFDVKKDFVLIQTLDDHSASITSIKFNMSESEGFQLLSCGADKSIIFRTAQQSPDLQFVRTTNFVGKATFYDMDIDTSRKYAATACQDRNVRVYDMSSGKQTRNYKGAQGDDGTLVRISLDPSGIYAATSCSDKTLSLTEFDSGDCVASMSGHSEVVTGVKFSVDCKNLISVSGDGCIFVWKIPSTYTQNMVERLVELGHEPDNKIQYGTPIRRETYQVKEPSILEIAEDNEFVTANTSAFSKPTRDSSPPVKDYRFSVGQLPAWAKKQLTAEGNEVSCLSPDEDNAEHVGQPGGRWAQRVKNGSMQVLGDKGTVQPISIPLNPADRKRYTIEPISVQEQMRALANSPLERRCSLTQGEDDDLFPQDGRAALENLKEEDYDLDEDSRELPSGVTMSRGSDVMTRKRKSSVVISQSGELKFEEAEESNEAEVKEVIIYLPPSQDDFDSEVASRETTSAGGHIAILNAFLKLDAPRVKEVVQHNETLQLTHHPSCPNIAAKQASDGRQGGSLSDQEPVNVTPRSKNTTPLYRTASFDFLPARVQTFLRSFQVSAAQRPQRLSLTVEDSKGEDQEGKDKPKTGDKERKSVSSEEEEEEVTSPSEDVLKPFVDDDNKSDAGDDVEAVGRYFETLGTSSPREKVDEPVSEPLPLDTEKLLSTRLSISARFLSRSQQGPSRKGGMLRSTGDEKEKISSSDADDSKQDLQRRKEEMALAVEATRKRLEALGWKAKEDILKKIPSSNVPVVTSTATPTANASSVASSLTTDTPRPSVSVSNEGDKEPVDTPVSSLKETPATSARPLVISNLLETRVIEEHGKKDHSTENGENSGSKMDSETKEEDPEKSKRSASHLIAFFSQSKSSKNKDKDSTKGKDKDKDKSKGGNEKDKEKEKGRSTPPPGKTTSGVKSGPGSKLDRRSSSGNMNPQKSEGKSWRKSLGILGGGSGKHDKDDKHIKKHLERRPSIPSESGAKNNQTGVRSDESRLKNELEENKTRKQLPAASSAIGTKPSHTGTKPGENSSQLKKGEKLNKKDMELPPNVAAEDTQSVLKTTGENNTMVSKSVPLREKKGRVRTEERRQKARSLGDLEKRLHKVDEVSILDPSVPPSRTVSTMDIPDQRKQTDQRPMSSAAVLESVNSNKHVDRSSPGKDHSARANEFSAHGETVVDLRLSDAVSPDVGSMGVKSGSFTTVLEDTSINGSTPSPCRDKKLSVAWEVGAEARDADKKLSPGKRFRSSGGSSLWSDISELSAELSAAIASKPPEPIRLSMSEANLHDTNPPSSSRRSPVGKDHESVTASGLTYSTCQQAVENLLRAFQNVSDLHSKVLNEEPSEEGHELLSHISATFSAIEEQIHRARFRRRKWEISSLQKGDYFSGSRHFGSSFSFSTGNLDQLPSKGDSLRRHSEFSVPSIPEMDAEHEDLLEKYSNRLLEMVAQKLGR